ncbi:MAG: ABC transporter substrate-binding protein [Pseudomonadota bacterium]
MRRDPERAERRLRASVLAGVAALALAGCADEPAGTGGDFTFALPGDPGGLDPHHSATYAPVMMLGFAYEGMVARGPDLEPRPGLAESWTQTSDSITYRLRDGLTCADGTPLTIRDVAENFAYIADPANGSSLLGAGVPVGAKVEVDAPGRAVTIRAAKPNSFLLDMTGGVPMVCRRGLQDRERLRNHTEGTGPFRLTEARANDVYVFERRQGRTWGIEPTSAAAPRRVVVRIVPNASTAANLLLAGEITAAGVTGFDRLRLERAGFKAVRSRSPAVQMWFNQAEARATHEEAVRRAMILGVDVGQLAKVAGGGHWVLPPRRLAGAEPMACATDTATPATPRRDARAAAALLDRAGWRLGADGIRTKQGRRLRLQLVYDRELTDASMIAAAVELAVLQWREIGIEVEARSLAGPMIGEVLFGTSDYDISWVPVIVSLPNRLMMFTSGPKPPKGLNFPNLDMPEAVALAATANTKAGPASCPDWDALEGLYLKSSAALPILDSDNPIYTRDATFRRGGLPIVADSVRLTPADAKTPTGRAGP